MNMFHVHPADPRNDFIILSPVDLDNELSIYQCYEKKRNYYFCPKCGVRCFTLSGTGEIDVVDLQDFGKGMKKVWHMKWDGEETTRPYVSVNGVTIDYREDFDLRVLTEEKKVQYFDDRTEPEEKKKDARWDRPHFGGSY